MNVVEVENLTKKYSDGESETVALNGVSFSVRSGEFLAIMGPSGSGKSTLLHLIGLLDSPTSGKRYIDGIDTSRMSEDEQARIRGDKIGFVFQTFNLIPSL